MNDIVRVTRKNNNGIFYSVFTPLGGDIFVEKRSPPKNIPEPQRGDIVHSGLLHHAKFSVMLELAKFVIHNFC
jgi:hypothetical protein